MLTSPAFAKAWHRYHEIVPSPNPRDQHRAAEQAEDVNAASEPLLGVPET